MKMIVFKKDMFFSNYFWSRKDGLIKEDILVKTYLRNYFTWSDFMTLLKLVGKDKLLKYSQEVGNYKRIKHLIDIYEKYRQFLFI